MRRRALRCVSFLLLGCLALSGCTAGSSPDYAAGYKAGKLGPDNPFGNERTAWCTNHMIAWSGQSKGEAPVGSQFKRVQEFMTGCENGWDDTADESP